MIDWYDIEILKRWLRRARKEGTDSIKIVAGNEANVFKVTELPERRGGEAGMAVCRKCNKAERVFCYYCQVYYCPVCEGREHRQCKAKLKSLPLWG